MEGLVLVTPPQTNLVVSVADTKQHLRIEADFTDDDTYIQNCIDTAVANLETYMNRHILNQSWRFILDIFPLTIKFPVVGVTSVTSVTYTDINGESQELSNENYIADMYSAVQSITFVNPPSGSNVQINFNCGYIDTASVPMPIKQAIMVLAAFYYRNRLPLTDNVKLDTAEALVYPYRLLEFE